MLILLYGLETVPISNANLRTLQSTWNVALSKIFKLENLSNFYYVQYFTDTLPVTYALDLRKLNFLQKQSVHHTSVINLLFSLTASKEFELLCKKYPVIQPSAHGRSRGLGDVYKRQLKCGAHFASVGN